MKDKKAIVRILVGIAAVGFVACGGGGGGGSISCDLFPCVDYDHAFCESCEAQNKVAYECNYFVSEWYADTSGLAERQYRLTGCYDSAAEAEAACEAACEGFPECRSLSVTEFYCDGVDNCSAGAAAPPAVSLDCSDWAPAAGISFDATNGRYVLDWGFWYGVMSDPYRIACETTNTVMPNVGSSGFTVDDVSPGSLADLLGLQSGDVLVSLNGQSLATLADVVTVATGLPNGTRFELVIERQGRSVTLPYIVQ